MANKGNIRKWVKALRSGKYTQTKGRCYRRQAIDENKAGYCCLGVANHICRLETGRHDVHNDIALGGVTRDWLDVGTVRPELRNTFGEFIRADNMNDGGASFDYIADAIERTFLKEEA